jgi:predicted transposase YdaD
MDTAIKRANEKIQVVANDREALHFYHMREMAIYDFNSGMSAARKEGIAIGEQRGKEEGREEGIAIGEQRGEQKGIAIGEQRGKEEGEKNARFTFALTLKNNGFSIEDAARYSGLAREEVINLFTEHGVI